MGAMVPVIRGPSRKSTCQAFAITGNAADTDPACELSPRHQGLVELAQAESDRTPPPFVYRRLGGAAGPSIPGRAVPV